MLRLLLPSIVSMVISMVILLLAYYFTLKAVPESKKWAKPVTMIAGGLYILIWLIYAINIASVNEVPRSKVDDSAVREATSNYEDHVNSVSKTERVRPDTLKIKNYRTK